MSETEGKSIKDPLVWLTMEMAERSRFVYDGWLPIAVWEAQGIRRGIRKIDQALSAFSLRGRSSLTWEPKYIPIDPSKPSTYMFEPPHIERLKKLLDLSISLSDADSAALLRSIAWLAQSVSAKIPMARFLFSILTIESLATYIQREATYQSVFRRILPQQLTKRERRTLQEECIKDTLDKLLAANPSKAVEVAYSQCVRGIEKTIRSHLERVMGSKSEASSLLFETRIEGKTLYELRHGIAHGKVDVLSEVQRERISERIWDVERVARRYVLKILELIMGESLFEEKVLAQMFFPVTAVSDARMYKGPTHMAEIYRFR